MKSLIILFADNYSNFGFEKVFDGKSAFDLTLDWAKNVKTASGIEVFCADSNRNLVMENTADGIKVKSKAKWTNESLFAEISDSLKSLDCDYALFSFAFNPFLNKVLTEKLIDTHEKFKSEYSFADGYPAGVSPEILDKGLVNILSELIKTKDDLNNQTVTKTSIFDLIKTDINSFEIETEISENDWRLYRFDFSCDKKENYLSCVKLFEKVKTLPLDDRNDVQKICEVASKEVSVLKTIPAYFNIQIESSYQSANPYCAYTVFGGNRKNTMSFDDFEKIIKQVSEINPDAVVSLSLWGDPLLHGEFFKFVDEILKYQGLSVLIETDGFNVSDEDFVSKLKKLSDKVSGAGLRKNGFAPVLWLVNIDAMTQNVYEKLHPGLRLENAVNSVKVLNELFRDATYAQYLRTTENEDELENFYRTYKEKEFVSGGNFVIQKYDHFCKKMPEVKSADLSPIERLPCWHLRRDFNILADGSVPVCRDKSFEEPAGNVLNESIDAIWAKINSVLQNHIENNYCKGCDCCDEFYTYNF